MSNLGLMYFLKYIGAAGIVILLLSVSEIFSAEPTLPSGQAMYEDVKYYSNLGDHRTATDVDHATSRWLEGRLAKAGYAVQVQKWPVRQFFPAETLIEIGSKTFKAFPAWWPKPTDEQGITAELTLDINEQKGRIFLFEYVTGAGFSVDDKFSTHIQTAADNGALAVICVTRYHQDDTMASDEFIGLNAMQRFRKEWPIPAVMVQARDFEKIAAAARQKSKVRFVSTGAYDKNAFGLNVIANLERGADFKTVLVTTPSSGWFTCAGERGSGIAIFLALAEWAAKGDDPVNWIFAATSGHELRGIGTEYYLKSSLVPPPDKLFLWIHIGAWQAMYRYDLRDGGLIPTREMDNRIIQFTGNDIATAVNAGFGSPDLKVRIIPRIVYGDLTQVVNHGYRNLAGISFGHEYHHSTQDLPEVTGPELLQSVAEAYKKFLRAAITE